MKKRGYAYFATCRVLPLQKEAYDQALFHYSTSPYKLVGCRQHGEYALPITERIHVEELSLPVGPTISRDEVETVIELVNAFAE